MTEAGTWALAHCPRWVLRFQIPFRAQIIPFSPKLLSKENYLVSGGLACDEGLSLGRPLRRQRHCFLSHTLLIGGLPGPKKKGEGPREEAAAATPRWLEVEAKAPCARVSCSARSGPSHTAGSGIGASLLRPLPIGTAGPLGIPDEG